jgi:hypothetical protein
MRENSKNIGRPAKWRRRGVALVGVIAVIASQSTGAGPK